MKWAERIQNLAWGLSILSWAGLALFAGGDDAYAPARLSIGVVNLVVGTLFLIRKPITTDSSWFSILLCLPSIITYAITFSLAAPTDQWPVVANGLIVSGGVLTVVSFLYLGRCFAIFPAVRGVVALGPYRLVRHPAYFGELMMVSACVVAQPTLQVGAMMLLTVLFLVVRIYDEERLLMQVDAYRDYSKAVIWRLAPGIW